MFSLSSFNRKRPCQGPRCPYVTLGKAGPVLRGGLERKPGSGGRVSLSMEGPRFPSRCFQRVLTLSGIACECKSHRGHFPRICWLPFLNCRQHIDYRGTLNVSYSELINASPLYPHVLSLKRKHSENITHALTLLNWTDCFVWGAWGESLGPPVANALGGSTLGLTRVPGIGQLASSQKCKGQCGAADLEAVEWGRFLQN